MFTTWVEPYLDTDVDAITHVGVEGDQDLELIFVVSSGEGGNEKAWRIIDRMHMAGLRFTRVGTYQQAFPPVDGVEICFGF